jgi:hypothetical protein
MKNKKKRQSIDLTNPRQKFIYIYITRYFNTASKLSITRKKKHPSIIIEHQNHHRRGGKRYEIIYNYRDKWRYRSENSVIEIKITKWRGEFQFFIRRRG